MSINRRQFARGAAVSLAAVAGCQGLGSSDQPSATDPTAEPTKNSTGTRTTASDEFSVTWDQGPDMPKRRTQTTAVALDGRLYVIGGIVDEGERTVAVYDPGEATWSTAAPPPDPVNHTAAVAYDGRIHVFGGYSGSFLGSPPLNVHWIYDPKTNQWSDRPALPTARGALVAVVASDRIYTIGGTSEEDTTALVEVYDPAEGAWSTASSMPIAREHLAAGVIDGNVYVAGGRQGLNPMVDTLENYNPEKDTWKERTSMPTARAGIAGAVLGNRLFVFGGEEVGEQVFEEVEAYNSSTDSWTTVTPLPTPRWGLGAATIGDSIYTVGGGAVPSAQETRTLEMLSPT